MRSRDRGKSWTDASAGIGYVDVHVIDNYPGSATRYYLSSAQGFYRTDDAGDRWYRAENGMPWADTPAYCYSHEWKMLQAIRRGWWFAAHAARRACGFKSTSIRAGTSC